MNRIKVELLILKIFHLIGSVVMAVGIFAEIGCFVFGLPSSAFEALVCIFLGAFIVDKAKRDRQELLESEDRE